jgi:alpha,alpha-trehalase
VEGTTATEIRYGRGRCVVGLEGLDAVILDLDGVLTDTASIHAAAWKDTFDEYLRERAARYGEAFVPFDAPEDYLRYIDGKPRYDGVRDFLRSRHISIPEGSPDDPPRKETVHGIGGHKNVLFLERLEKWGVKVYPSSVEFVRRLRGMGIKVALISASRNLERVLQKADLGGMFDAVVGGTEAQRLGLRGKPAPDIFLEAAKRVGADPNRSAVVEDAQSGVEAGKAGGFALVIGVDRTGQREALMGHGADVVVKDLSEVQTEEAEGAVRRTPSALVEEEAIFRRLQEGVPAVFLDYDGTLTPIVRRPPLAVLSARMRDVLGELAGQCRVAVVSGRDLEDVRKMVGLDNLAYVGSHGFELLGPQEQTPDRERGKAFLPSLEQAQRDLTAAVGAIPGAWVERKRFALAVHFREVDPSDVPRLEELFNGVARRFPDLKRTGGKKVFELRPNVDWDKGKVVLYLLDMLHMNGSQVVPLYIGDDETDEDAFKALNGRGITILVSDRDAESAAGYVLRDVDEVYTFLRDLADRFAQAAAHSIWTLDYDGFEPDKEKLREALCTLGNGYFASRGAAPESRAGPNHYPGNYLAGVYNRRESRIADHAIENESMVNVPNWLCLSFGIGEDEWFDLEEVEIDSYRQELDLRKGVLRRKVRFTDGRGHRTLLEQSKFVSMDSPHLAGLETTITPENWSGTLPVRSGLDGRVDNTLVKRYRQLNNHHLDPLAVGTTDREGVWLKAETNQSQVRIAVAARTKVFQDDRVVDIPRRTAEGLGYIGQVLDVPMKKERPTRVEKIAAIYSSKDRAISEPLVEATNELDRAEGFAELCRRHEREWENLWRRCQISVEADGDRIAQILNLHIFHLLQTVSVHSIDLDVGVPPRGLHGEAYRGLIMWDEIFIFPLLNLRIPSITRSLLLYRHRRLPLARQAARAAGYAGAMFPWQSGSDGREEGQVLHYNPLSGRWIPDNTQLERHISLAIAYNLWQYYQISGDMDFMSFYGAEMLIEIARFWAGKAEYNESTDRYEVRKVMGPDEFHERYPGATEPGIDNNAYTNVMVTWLMCRALDIFEMLPVEQCKAVRDDLSLEKEELDRWRQISRKMYVPFHGDGIVSQFQGYDDLKELDWERYRGKYGNINRLDRILEAEGDSPNRYKISKQADVLMLFYLFSVDELKELFDRLGYSLEAESIPRIIDYYLARTSHGSTLSRVVHAWVLSRSNREESWNLFREALQSDISDTQGGTTHEGIHLGAMAGTVDIVQRCYSGLEARNDVLWFNPSLPKELKRLQFDIVYRRHRIMVDIDQKKARLVSRPQNVAPISVGFGTEVRRFAPGDVLEFAL